VDWRKQAPRTALAEQAPSVTAGHLRHL
jgi:hypothetical protein